ncbi:MAG: DUF4393 domain-containing protein [Rhizobacter sp.]|nr:DUF4393 domain-containing protein [Ferruginibacter sp.]
MANIEKIVDNLNMPKQILDKSEALLKGLFGQSFDEIGGMIADQVRLRRFKNQITIFTKAQKILKDKNIDPKKISLKVLAPLIEYSSYEEEESIQDKWSSLTVYILENSSDIAFQQNCISILNKLSSEEATFLDFLFVQFSDKRLKSHARAVQRELELQIPPRELEDYSLGNFAFSIFDKYSISRTKVEFLISNLVAFGILKWETEVDVEASKSSHDPGDNEIEVNVDVDGTSTFIFTRLGIKFIEICKSSK